MKILVTLQPHYTSVNYDCPLRYALEERIINVDIERGAFEEAKARIYQIKDFLVDLTEMLYVKGILSDKDILKLSTSYTNEAIAVKKEE